MQILITTIVLAPFWVGWIILLTLAPYRRDGRGTLATIFHWQLHALRPDFYTDEGQRLLRWLWVVAVLTIPWLVFTGMLLEKAAV